MHGYRPLMGRRHFLAGAAIGTIGAFLPLSPAHASTTTPAPPGAETLSPTTTSPAAAPASVFGAASAAVEASGDTSIRPFQYHASDAELADLKRRIKATKWPDRETVNDDTQGVQLGDDAQARRPLGQPSRLAPRRRADFPIPISSPTSTGSTSTSST